ncbi:MAG: DsrE/DsrF/DrsH-like family protein [Reyranellaceae bacterium]
MADTPPALSIIALSGDYERVHYALAMAAAARAVGRPTTLFFTQKAITALMHAKSGEPLWQRLPADDGSSSDGRAGFADALDAGVTRDNAYKARGVGDFETLLSACVEMGVRVIVCEMGLRAQNIDRDALRKDVPHEIAGIVTLLDATPAGSQLVTL